MRWGFVLGLRGRAGTVRSSGKHTAGLHGDCPGVGWDVHRFDRGGSDGVKG